MSEPTKEDNNLISLLIGIAIFVTTIAAAFYVFNSAFVQQGMLAKQCFKYQDTVLAEMPAKCVKLYQ